MDNPRPAKRSRLSLACDRCRSRKVKCDAEQPLCRPCQSRNETCVTTDPRRPGVPVVREIIDFAESISREATTIGHDTSSYDKAPSPLRYNTKSFGTVSGTDHNKKDRLRAGSSQPDTHDISPVQQPFYEVSFSTDGRPNKAKMMGGSSSQCLAKTLDLYLHSHNLSPCSGFFAHGMQHAEELSMPLIFTLPPLPSSTLRKQYSSVFFSRIHPLYPLFDIDKTKNLIDELAALPDLRTIPSESVPQLASAYLIMSLGADELAQTPSAEGGKYFRAAISLLGHVILVPYVPALQALILYTIRYRSMNKDGMGWQTLGIVIRIAHSLGMHRYSAVRPSQQHGIQQREEQLFQARIWAICCSLEKIMELESGRPSSLQSVDTDQMMLGPDQIAPGHDYLHWHMKLASFQNEISQHLYGHKLGHRTSAQILLDTARLDRELTEWTNDIPSEFRPGNDLFCADEDVHVAAHLSVHYHQTMIALHRAALISSNSRFEQEVTNHVSDARASARLRKGEAICVSSARAIARISLELHDRGAESLLLNIGPPLLACIVLSIYLVKKPPGRMSNADLELLKSCAEHTQDQGQNTSMNEDFCRGIIAIYEQARARLANHSTTNQPRSKQKGVTVLRNKDELPQGTEQSFVNNQPQYPNQPWPLVAGLASSTSQLASGPTISQGLAGQQIQQQQQPGHAVTEFQGPEYLPDTQPAGMDLQQPNIGLFDTMGVADLYGWMLEDTAPEDYLNWNLETMG